MKRELTMSDKYYRAYIASFSQGLKELEYVQMRFTFNNILFHEIES